MGGQITGRRRAGPAGKLWYAVPKSPHARRQRPTCLRPRNPSL